MRLAEISIRNFRGIKELQIPLEDCTVLIGENNTGKSSVLDAIQIVMSRNLGRRAQPFGASDFFLKDSLARVEECDPIQVDLLYEERTLGEWSRATVQLLGDVVQVASSGSKFVKLSVKFRFDPQSGQFSLESGFLNAIGVEIPSVRTSQAISDLQRLAPIYLLEADRDAKQHFRANSPLWGSFVKAIPQDRDQYDEFAKQLGELNRELVENHEPFSNVRDHLAKVGDLLGTNSEEFSSIEVISSSLTDLLARSQVKLSSQGGVQLPTELHGSGTQSLSVMFLFEAFLTHQLSAETQQKFPLLALEEPEAHLHPSAIRALWTLISGFSGQKIIATHSGDLISAVPLLSIRRLAYKQSQLKVFTVAPGNLNQDELASFDYHAKLMRGSLLFSRCWLFVEGEADLAMVSRIAKIMAFDLDRIGITCVTFSNSGLEPFLKVANDLGIEWHLLTDGDQAGSNYVSTAKRYLGGRSPSAHITQLSSDNMELMLWDLGFQHIYEQGVSPSQRRMISELPGTPAYAKRVIKMACSSTSKPRLARLVCDEIEAIGASAIPKNIEQSINSAVALSEI